VPRARRRILEHEKAVVEGGGAAGLAALLPGGPLDIPELKNKKVPEPCPCPRTDQTLQHLPRHERLPCASLRPGDGDAGAGMARLFLSGN